MSLRRSITGYVSSAEKERVFAGGTGYGTATGSGTTASVTVGGVPYTLITFASDGTLYVNTPGLFDFMLVGGGGASGNCNFFNPAPQWGATSGGGGGGGVIGLYEPFSVFLDTGLYDMDVGVGGQMYYSTNGYQSQGWPGRPSRVFKSTDPIGTMFEALGGGGGSGGSSLSGSDSWWGNGRDGANGGGGHYSSFPWTGEGLSHAVFSSSTYYPFGGGATMKGGRVGGNGYGGGSSGNGAGGGAGAGLVAHAVGGNASINVGGFGGSGAEISGWTGQGTYYVGAGGGGGGNSTGGAAGLGGVPGGGGQTSGIPGVNYGAGAGGCGYGPRLGAFGAPGAIWVRFKV